MGRAVLALKIEGVVHLAGRMLGRDVQRREVVEIILDVRPLGDGEAHLAEDRDAFLGHLADRVQMPARPRARRQGDINRLVGEARLERDRIEIGLARCDRILDRILHPVEGLTGLLAGVAVELAQALHLRGDTALLAKRRHADSLERVEIVRRRHFGEQCGLQLGDFRRGHDVTGSTRLIGPCWDRFRRMR